MTTVTTVTTCQTNDSQTNGNNQQSAISTDSVLLTNDTHIAATNRTILTFTACWLLQHQTLQSSNSSQQSGCWSTGVVRQTRRQREGEGREWAKKRRKSIKEAWPTDGYVLCAFSKTEKKKVRVWDHTDTEPCTYSACRVQDVGSRHQSQSDEVSWVDLQHRNNEASQSHRQTF